MRSRKTWLEIQEEYEKKAEEFNRQEFGAAKKNHRQ
jgi:hypothetical protein